MNVNTCPVCGSDFINGEWERDFCQKMEVPPPRRCPECRSQRRLAEDNQLNLFKRTCAATKKAIISNIPEQSPFTVVSQEYWYSEECDGLNYGRAYDFSMPFFEQYAALLRDVPRPALFTDYLKDENCAYTNFAGKNKNCYLIFDADENRDCLYSYGINSCINAVDCYRTTKVELCYQAVDSHSCYHCSYIDNCESCSDSALLSNCIGCKNCVMCSNLRHQEFYFRNEPCEPGKIAEILVQFQSFQERKALVDQFEECRRNFPQKYMHGTHNEDVTGDYLLNCKNAFDCYDCRDLWDGKYCTQIFMKAKDCLDVDEVGSAELCYQSTHSGYNGYNLKFCIQCLEQVSNLTYCRLCMNGATDCFGCVGLRRKSYCILNRQYSKGEYFDLLPRVIAQMKETGEWGEFFPEKLAASPYNLSLANEWYPLSREEALQRGYGWHEASARDYQSTSAPIADNLGEISDGVTKEILSCAACKRNYRIIPAELKFYRSMGQALPRQCFHCRHLGRVLGRNPRQLWQRECHTCRVPLSTTYAPARPERVLCEQCYLVELQ